MDSPPPESTAREKPPSKPPDRFDVLRYADDSHRPVPAGRGQQVVTAHESEARQRRLLGSLTVGILPPITGVLFGLMMFDAVWLLGGIGLVVGLLGGVFRYLHEDHQDRIPEVVVSCASPRVVSDYVEAFDPDDVSSPFK